MKATGYAALAAAISIFLLAASMSRVYAANGRVIVVVGAMALYIVGNLLMVHVMRVLGLGMAISAATIAQLILINIVALTVFGERPGPTQTVGIALGLVSLTLILMPVRGP